MYGHRKVSDRQVTEVPVSFLAVVQNALGHAWRIMLEDVAEGRFSICNAHEDVITERLYMILGWMHVSEPEAVGGFAMFETPVREGNLRNHRGDRLDCQPDLTFRPVRGQISTKNSATTGIFVECKPVDSQHPIGSAYCAEGISRFVCGDYAWAVDRAIMLAYVRNVCELPDGLRYILRQKRNMTKYRVVQQPKPLSRTSKGDPIYCTVHNRSLSTSITLHHLWLSPEEPCEHSRCRT
jgi:hypothetical protein